MFLTELTVRAPRAARVETLDLRPGDIIAANATVARLLEQDQLYVRIYVPETRLGYVKPGLELPFSVDTFPKRSFKAVVESVRHEGEFSPRNLMKNYEGFLRQLTRKTVDEALSSDEFDFVEKISADFPIQVLARLLDVPREDT